MTKQLFFTAILVCSTFLSVAAQETVVENIEVPTVMFEGDLRDLMYADHSADGRSKARLFANPDEAIIHYRDRITNMPQFLLDFIDKYVEAGRDVLNGGSNWLSDPQKGSFGFGCYYLPLAVVTGSAPFYFPAGSDAATIQKAATDAAQPYLNAQQDILSSFMPYAFLIANYDHPEFFWIGNAFNYGCGLSCSLSYYSTGMGTVTYTITHIFILNSGRFDIRNNGVETYNYRDATNLANGIKSFKNSKATILAQCQTGSRYDKLLAAHDWLTTHNCYNPLYLMGYNQSIIGDTPWSPISALEGHNDQMAPVCEGYARAFKILCDEMGIPCILMSGTAFLGSNSGGHMWNYVQMEDGKWYAIDVTWDDPSLSYVYDVVSGHETHDWFLLGSTSDVGEGLTFIESHPEEWIAGFKNNGSYTWNLVPGPELAPLAWTPVASVPGDTNNDNHVDATDLQFILNIIADSGYNKDADTNGDGKVDAVDYQHVMNIIGGQE